MSRTQPQVHKIELRDDNAVCYICGESAGQADDPAYATGRGRSQRIYCSARCADPRPCTTCPHPQRQHDRFGCFAPVVDRRGHEDACGCRTARIEV